MSTRVADAVNKGGRPTKYLATYCTEVKDFMGLGYSIAAFAGHIGVARETVYEWERTIPEFAEAIAIARGKRVKALEEGLLKESQAGPAVTARIFALKNADPREWRDRIEHTGDGGGPIVIATALEEARRRVAIDVAFEEVKPALPAPSVAEALAAKRK
jgi:DNA-binding XRE family transcriptional regulator